MEHVFTSIFNFNLWADSGFQGTPPGQETHYIQGREGGGSNGLNMWLWVNILFMFVQQTTTKKTLTLEYHRCTLSFLLCLIPCVATSMSVTLIICSTWAQNFHTHISHSTLKLLRFRKCSLLVGGRFQRNISVWGDRYQNIPTWLGRSCLFLFLTDYYQVQTLFCYFFLLIVETPSRHMCWNALVIWRLLLLVLFIIQF